MVIIFNLAALKRDLQDLSNSPEGLAFGMLQEACAQAGLPVGSVNCSDLSVGHRYIYDQIEAMVEEKLFNVSTPKRAGITHLGNMIFHVDIHQ